MADLPFPQWIPSHVGVSPRVASILIRRVDLTALRIEARTSDRELYDTLATLYGAGLAFDQRASLERSDAPDRAKEPAEAGEADEASTCWADTAEVAEQLGVGSRQVQALATAGELRGELRSRRWFIDLASVAEYRKNRKRRAA